MSNHHRWPAIHAWWIRSVPPEFRLALILLGCLLVGAASGLASLWLSILPSLVNHHMTRIVILGACYNERLGFVNFLGVSIQGIVLAWLLTTVTAHSDYRHLFSAAFFLLFAVLVPGPAALYPIVVEYDWWIRCGYELGIGLTVALLTFRRYREGGSHTEEDRSSKPPGSTRIVLGLLIVLSARATFAQGEVWLTNPDRSALFERQGAPLTFSAGTNEHPTIEVDDATTYQTIDGFGFTLTGGSAMHIVRMTPPARAALLRELFATDSTNIGTSYLRLSIGASDLNERVFSYDDLPPGETDPDMKRFDLGPDRADVIPALKEILAMNPAIKLMGSPWSAPAWMKTTNDTRGASLKPHFHDAYAKYLVKYIQAMKAEGIRVDAITVQNEPLHAGNNPSMFMSATQQATFIKLSLGPAFAAAKLDTKIIIYDHNCNRPDYPLYVLNDPAAAKYVDGSAFHLYAGKIDVLAKVHDAHPDKNIYFTEQWVGAPGDLQKELPWHVRELIIGATRNWSRTVLEWNLAANSRWEPHTDRGGCTRCVGAVTIEGDQVTRNPAYYIIAHASKFVRPGSVRIASNTPPTLPNVAFKTPEGRHVLIVLNNSREQQSFNISHQGRVATSVLKGNSVATFVW